MAWQKPQMMVLALAALWWTSQASYAHNKNCYFTTDKGQVIDMESQDKTINTSRLGSEYDYYYNPCTEFDLPERGTMR